MVTRTIPPSTLRHGDRVPAHHARTGTSPRETWPLLGTVVATLGAMYGAIQRQATPAVAGMILAGVLASLIALLTFAGAVALARGARPVTAATRRPQPRTTGGHPAFPPIVPRRRSAQSRPFRMSFRSEPAMRNTIIETTNPPTTGPGHPASAFSRRRAVGGAVGAVGATVGLARLGFAQTTGTPEASTAATPTTGTGTTTSDDTDTGASRLDAVVERANAVIAAVQVDRDAAASEIDTGTVDAVLAEAARLLTDARDTSATADVLRLAHAASGTALAARQLIIAQLTYPGLPSQENRASRVLAIAYERITIAGDAATAGDTDVSFFVSTAQELYTSAYDLYGNDAYAQSSATARAAAGLAAIAHLLSGGDPDLRGQAGGQMPRRMPQGGMGPGLLAPDDHDEMDVPAVDDGDSQGVPVTVPEPAF